MSSQTISYPRFQRTSDHSLLVTFGHQISRKHHHAVALLLERLRQEPDPGTINVHPAYTSLLVSFNPLITHPATFEEYIRGLVHTLDRATLRPARTVTVPVCYDPEFAPDLGFVAEHTKLSTGEITRRHCGGEYLVYFIGFAPGFAYLGDLPAELAVPRLPTPRLNVPAGSVALAGYQTGIYSVLSPGGWRIIGRTPLDLFDPQKTDPTFFRFGDSVRFREISKAEFLTFAGGGGA